MQLSTLQGVYAHPGPYVTVHMDVSRNSENAAQQIDARWTTARRTLESEGVDETLIQEVGRRLQEPVNVGGEVRRTIIASDGEVVFDEVTAGHSMWPEVVTTGELPDMSGWLHQVDGQLPFMLVVADREGADIDFYPSLTTADSVHREVDGNTANLHKFHGGGWSHKRFQRRSENQWESNAREVADEIRSAVARRRPRVLLLAGDQRACTLIEESLDGVQCEIAHLGAGGRAAGSSTAALWEDVRLVLARLEAEGQEELTGRLEEKWGQGAGAVLGVDDVIDALVQHKVDTLIVDLQKAREVTVDPTRYPGLPLPEQALGTHELPADQVLVAAGAATDAAIAVLPSAQTKGGGVAAMLRWDDRRPSETV